MHIRLDCLSLVLGLMAVRGGALGAPPPPEPRYKLALQAPPANSVNSVAVSPDGALVATAANEGGVRLHDARTGALVRAIEEVGDRSVTFSPDGRTVVTAGVDRSIKLWDLTTGKELGSRKDAHWLKSLSFSPDGRWLAYAGGHEDVGLLDLTGRRPEPIGIPASIGPQHRKAT